eukprot:gb/GECG01012166.1/.p1 GENE.gb/GECG01012166.1/~~gb/GECG01012166.1/.p1  ORF type:complete len:386 (+),score=34.96 gb/GECG01012166.1/:1-1158(+)
MRESERSTIATDKSKQKTDDKDDLLNCVQRILSKTKRRPSDYQSSMLLTESRQTADFDPTKQRDAKLPFRIKYTTQDSNAFGFEPVEVEKNQVVPRAVDIQGSTKATEDVTNSLRLHGTESPPVLVECLDAHNNNTETANFKCPFCRTHNAAERGSLARHMRVEHKSRILSEKRNGKQPHKCALRILAELYPAGYLNSVTAAKKRRKQSRFCCDRCPLTFASQTNLSKHTCASAFGQSHSGSQLNDDKPFKGSEGHRPASCFAESKRTLASSTSDSVPPLISKINPSTSKGARELASAMRQPKGSQSSSKEKSSFRRLIKTSPHTLQCYFEHVASSRQNINNKHAALTAGSDHSCSRTPESKFQSTCRSRIDIQLAKSTVVYRLP